VELWRQLLQDFVHHRADRSQRMVTAHSLLWGDVAEHVTLLLIASSHASSTRSALLRYTIPEFFSSLLVEGNWQEDLLFLLKQEQKGYEFCQKQIAECDGQLQQYLNQREDRSAGTSLPEEQRKERLRKKKENKPQFDLRAELFHMTGTDLTQIYGIDVRTAATVISEAGWDMSKWRTDDHFVSWLRLCPDSRVSGDKVIGKGRLPTNNRLTVALKMAASCLRQSNSYLGAQFGMCPPANS
jgi:transposase